MKNNCLTLVQKLIKYDSKTPEYMTLHFENKSMTIVKKAVDNLVRTFLTNPTSGIYMVDDAIFIGMWVMDNKGIRYFQDVLSYTKDFTLLVDTCPTRNTSYVIGTIH